MKEQKVKDCMDDLETATTIGYFEMRVEDLKKIGAELPKNIDYLRQQAVDKNIRRLEREIVSANNPVLRAKYRQDWANFRKKYKHLL
ncbi:hypothetical protein HZB88_02375 [archaeon]|nr:hypothetical protein [archaeon]